MGIGDGAQHLAKSEVEYLLGCPLLMLWVASIWFAYTVCLW